jgi:hypothetical protein
MNNNDTLLKEALQLLEEWQDLAWRAMSIDRISTMDLKKKQELDDKTADLLGKEQQFLSDHQKHYVGLFLQNKCNDEHLLRNLGLSKWSDVERLIRRYRIERAKEGKNE